MPGHKSYQLWLCYTLYTFACATAFYCHAIRLLCQSKSSYFIPEMLQDYLKCLFILCYPETRKQIYFDQEKFDLYLIKFRNITSKTKCRAVLFSSRMFPKTCEDNLSYEDKVLLNLRKTLKPTYICFNFMLQFLPH